MNKDYILVNGEHEPIISNELWDRVQIMYELKSGKPKRISKKLFPLTGILKCPVCGYGMVANRVTNTLKDGTKRTHYYYSCGNWRNKGTAVCSVNSIRADLVEEYVFNRIKEVVTYPKLMTDIIKNLNQQRKEVLKPLEEQIALAKKAIAI